MAGIPSKRALLHGLGNTYLLADIPILVQLDVLAISGLLKTKTSQSATCLCLRLRKR